MFRRLLILFAFVTYLSITSVALADQHEWKESLFDFSQTKQIIVLGPYIQPNVTQPNAQAMIDPIFEKVKKQDKKVTFLSTKQFVEMAQKDFDNIPAITATPNDLLIAENYGSKYADAILIVNVLSLGDVHSSREPSVHTEETIQQTWVTRTIIDSNGKARTIYERIQYPVSQEVQDPGGDYITPSANAELELIDIKSKKIVWRYSDSRQGSHEWLLNLFHNPTSKGLITSILEDGIDHLPAGK